MDVVLAEVVEAPVDVMPVDVVSGAAVDAVPGGVVEVPVDAVPGDVVEVPVDVVPGDVVDVPVDVVVVAPLGVVRATVAEFEEVVDALVVVRGRGLATGVGGLEEGRARTGSRAPVDGAG